MADGIFSPRPPYHQRLLSGEPLRPPAGAGQKGPFASRSGTTVTTQWHVAAGTTKTRAAPARLLHGTSAKTTARLGTGCAGRQDHFARPDAADCRSFLADFRRVESRVSAGARGRFAAQGYLAICALTYSLQTAKKPDHIGLFGC